MTTTISLWFSPVGHFHHNIRINKYFYSHPSYRSAPNSYVTMRAVVCKIYSFVFVEIAAEGQCTQFRRNISRGHRCRKRLNRLELGNGSRGTKYKSAHSEECPDADDIDLLNQYEILYYSFFGNFCS